METQQKQEGIKPKLNIGFFFLSLGVLVSLVTSVVSFLNLIFATLDKRFPDVLNATYQYGYSSYDYESMRIALATLIIFFPVFLLVSFYWKKYINGAMGQIDEILKKWLIYIVLFLSAVVTVVDLVTLVRYFVGGEITNRFILKVVATLVVALFVGIYYILQLKNKNKVFGFSVDIWAVIKSCILVLALVFFSFYIMGSPVKQRLYRLDDRRITDLQSIQYQVINFWQQKEKLPEKFSDLSNPLSGYSLPVDPEFEKGFNYEYIIKEEKDSQPTFELCATFALPIPKGWREYSSGGGVMPMYEKTDVAVSYPYPGPGYGGINESWDHQAGRTCFTRTIDKDIYPPYPKSETRKLF